MEENLLKKIGILTINDYTNYGNRLQNYAVQEVLKSIGVEPTTIVNTTLRSRATPTNNSRLLRLLKILLKRNFKQIKKLFYLKVNSHIVRESRENKIKNFKLFTAQYIKETNFTISIDSIPKNLNDNFDYFITGSDQVWNPSFRHFSKLDFLTFAPKEKRIAYSPSFGISKIPKEFEEKFKGWINGMNHLSVREESGEKIIKELSNREAIVLIDPTMMLDEKEWLKISRKSKYKPKNKYLCTYFLGETYETHRKEILKIAKENELDLINLGNLYDLKRYSVDPSEFLDFIVSSDLFLTDSFHGVIFSILFSKPFVVFNRIGTLPSMNSRIETLLSKFKLEDRSWEIVNKTRQFYNIDFSLVPSILESERNKAYKYLKNAFDIKDE